MTKLDHALKLAAFGFFVFPIKPGAKSPPLIQDFPTAASRHYIRIEEWWHVHPNANIGISTSRFGDDHALLVIDVDNKEGQYGNQELLRLECEGYDLPDTFCQVTPTGGRHVVYRVATPVRQGASVLGRNLDVRSKGGYVVGAGSTIEGKEYVADFAEIVDAPEWVIERCGKDRAPDAVATGPVVSVDFQRARQRAITYLENSAPLAIQGQGGDDTTYRVAATIKDFGVGEYECAVLMDAHWNARCSPPWSDDELDAKVRHAYRYGNNPPAIAAPEYDFEAVDPGGNEAKTEEKPHPVLALNKHFAFVTVGGGSHVLWETTDHHGRYKLEHLTMTAFHNKFANRKIRIGKREEHISELWMEEKERREYQGLVFMPEQQAPPAFYNLWRGFAYEPAEKGGQHEAVDMFLDHAKTNVCAGDDGLFRWLMGYFSHLIQRPWEKPLVALVFRGAKGVGKNALVERVGALLGGHFLVTSNRRYLIGNFNGHLENCLLFALDEAFWSGDKQAEGALKDLITGREHVIEHKGKEPYTVANKTRVVIIGNEDWLVPATHDERRFAVFAVGDGRKQDRTYFTAMREGMERGGYPVLLRYLLDYDLRGLDLNAAPATKGLADQKHSSLEPFHQWWVDSLEEGRLIASEYPAWPTEPVECDRVRSAFRRYAKERNIRARLPDDKAIGRQLTACCPIHEKIRLKKQEDGSQPYAYRLPPLDRARAQWDTFIGYPTEWKD